MMRCIFMFGISASLSVAAIAAHASGPVCGSGSNADICFASIDQSQKLKPEQRERLALVGTQSVDIISLPAFESELTAFYKAHGNSGPHRDYWKDFDPKTAIAKSRASFDGLHIETIGGLRGWLSANFGKNLAYEGGTRPDGSRDILLNRFRLNRSTAGLVGTYVHEAAHKAGYSHRPSVNEDQKCEPPYVMGQIAQKLADPVAWLETVKTKNVCRFFKGI
jgi:hypothetical protein